MRRFGTESTRRSSSREATAPRVDEAAMQAKLKELRGLMASEHAARETIRDIAELNGGSIWRSSRRPEERARDPVRASAGSIPGRGAHAHRIGPRLRDLSAEDMSLVERARARASAEVARVGPVASRRPDIPERRPGAASRGAGRVRTSVDVIDHLRPDLIARAMGVNSHPTHAHRSSRPGNSTPTARPRSPRVEHVVLHSADLDLRGRLGEGRLVPRPPPGLGPSSRAMARPASGGGGGGARAGRFGGVGMTLDGAATTTDDDDLSAVEPVGGGGRPPTGERRRAPTDPGASSSWRSSTRDGADVLTARGDDGGDGVGDGVGDRDGVWVAVTAGGVEIVDESGGALLRGEFDEEANARAFAEALREWRGGGGGDKEGGGGEEGGGDKELVVRESTRPTTAAAEIDVQTDGAGGGLYTGARRSSSPWGVAARPLAAKPGASYFERLFAKNVERMAGKKVMESMRAE